MKTIIKYLGIAIFALSVFSCSKDDDEITQLTKNIRLNNYSINDVPFNMSYNNDDLLIEYEYGNTFSIRSRIEYDNSGNIIKNGAQTFTYNTQGKIETITKNVSPSMSIVFTIAYNTEGFPERITANHSNGETATTQLEYNSNNKPIIVL